MNTQIHSKLGLGWLGTMVEKPWYPRKKLSRLCRADQGSKAGHGKGRTEEASLASLGKNSLCKGVSFRLYTSWGESREHTLHILLGFALGSEEESVIILSLSWARLLHSHKTCTSVLDVPVSMSTSHILSRLHSLRNFSRT